MRLLVLPPTAAARVQLCHTLPQTATDTRTRYRTTTHCRSRRYTQRHMHTTHATTREQTNTQRHSYAHSTLHYQHDRQHGSKHQWRGIAHPPTIAITAHRTRRGNRCRLFRYSSSGTQQLWHARSEDLCSTSAHEILATTTTRVQSHSPTARRQTVKRLQYMRTSHGTRRHARSNTINHTHRTSTTERRSASHMRQEYPQSQRCGTAPKSLPTKKLLVLYARQRHTAPSHTLYVVSMVAVRHGA